MIKFLKIVNIVFKFTVSFLRLADNRILSMDNPGHFIEEVLFFSHNDLMLPFPFFNFILSPNFVTLLSGSCHDFNWSSSTRNLWHFCLIAHFPCLLFSCRRLQLFRQFFRNAWIFHVSWPCHLWSSVHYPRGSSDGASMFHTSASTSRFINRTVPWGDFVRW